MKNTTKKNETYEQQGCSGRFALSKFNDLQSLRDKHTSAHWYRLGTFTRNPMYLFNFTPLVNWKVVIGLVPCIAKARQIKNVIFPLIPGI
jgi:hypothetical protein